MGRLRRDVGLDHLGLGAPPVEPRGREVAKDGILASEADGPALVSRRRSSVAVHVSQDEVEAVATQLLGQSMAVDPPKPKLVCGHDVVVVHPPILSSRRSVRRLSHQTVDSALQVIR